MIYDENDFLTILATISEVTYLSHTRQETTKLLAELHFECSIQAIFFN